MKVQTRPQTPPPPPPQKEEHWWEELTDHDLVSLGLHLKLQDLRQVSNAMKGAGKSLAGAWKDLRKHIDQVLGLPFLEDHFSAETRKTISNVVVDVGKGLGFATAGVAGLSGVVKLRDKEGGKIRHVEGLMDLATAGLIATTVAGLAVAPMVLGPLGAALGVAKGGLSFAKGFKDADGRLETQGALDSSRSLGTVCSRLGGLSGVLATAGAVLGAVGAAIQLVRGAIDVDRGLKGADKGKELQGLTDMGMAVGMMMAATGLGTVPGVVLTVASVATRVLYAVSKKMHKRMDGWLQKAEPAMLKVDHGVIKVGTPVIKLGRKVIEVVTGWHHGHHWGR